jgi:hypothetical protein
MSVDVALNDALYTVLHAGLGTVGVYHMQAPENITLPYVVYSWQGGGRVGNTPDLINRLEFVRAYGTTQYQAGTLDDKCASLLDNVNIPVAGWTTITMMRQDDYETVETQPNENPIYTMGGIYRIILDI